MGKLQKRKAGPDEAKMLWFQSELLDKNLDDMIPFVLSRFKRGVKLDGLIIFCRAHPSLNLLRSVAELAKANGQITAGPDLPESDDNQLGQ